MPKGLLPVLKQILADKRRHRLWLRVVSGMMAVVVFCTTYALILPAITMEHKTYCGLEEHHHTDECYAVKNVAKKSLICKPEEEAEFVIHIHNDFCFDDASNLICDLSELEEHIHTEDCYTGGELICGKAESEGHTHSEECYERVQGELTCTSEDEEHEHNDDCYEWTSSLICGQEEAEAHTHGEGCYNGEAELVCDIPEVEPHKHEDSCYESGVLACGKPEVVTHEHTAECVQQEDEAEEERVLICGMVEHTHTEECFVPPTDDVTSGGANTVASDKTTSATALENGENPKQLTFAYSDDNISGVITIDWSEKLPEDLQCTVVKLDMENEENFLQMSNSVNSAMRDENKSVSQLKLYRLEWTSNGRSYTLPRAIKPVVTITALDDESSATLMGAVITDKNAKQDLVFDEISGIDSLTGTSDLTEINNVIINLYSAEELDEDEDTATSEQALQIYNDEDTSDSDEVPDYETETVAADDSNGFELELEATSTFALLKAYDASTVSGNYYKRVDSLSELDSSKRYVFMFANSNAALYEVPNGNGAYAVKPMIVHSVETCSDVGKYVTLSTVDNPDVTINTVNGYNYNFTIVPNEYGTNWVYSYYYYFTYPYDNKTYYEWTFQHDDTTNAWWIYTTVTVTTYDEETDSNIKSYVLRILSYNDRIGYYTGEESVVNGSTNILIYEYVGGELEVENDIEEVEAIDDTGIVRNKQMTKPDYASYTPVSETKKESAVLGELHEAAGATVDCVSDASTSQIESKLGMAKSNLTKAEQLEIQKENDGRLVTDKSVVYGKDDYSAIGEENYDAGDFSVTLSAVGQEWKVDETQTDTTPVDVVFIYDISNSMTSRADPNDPEDTSTRWIASSEAINKAMKAILDNNPNNRVGVVEFSDNSAPVLEIGRYTADNDEYFTYTSASKLSSLKVANSVLDSYTGVAPDNAGKTLNSLAYGMCSATYTQRGLQEAYEMFSRADTTVKLSSGQTIKRQPIIMLVTDGDPTLCSYNYMNPKEGPNYGYGATYGIEGYYAILSANYFKNKTSIHYNKKAIFYTIGMGILSEGYGNTDSSYVKHDHSYMRAVLNPTEENIDALDSYLRFNPGDTRSDTFQKELWSVGGQQLQRLLRETCMDSTGTKHISNGEYVFNICKLMRYSGGSMVYDYMEDKEAYATMWRAGLGYMGMDIRGIDNPYKDNYSYADAAFFGDLSEEDMENIFESILDNVQTTSRYDFLLKDGSNITMTDPLGDGMVVKGSPVLRYFGVNYTDSVYYTTSDSTNIYVTYYWNDTATRQTSDAKSDDTTVDLSSVKVIVATNKTTGAQTVSLVIPENALPTFYPDDYHQFYYEELPIRVIYRVGLSTAEETKLNEEAGGRQGAIKNKVYYTNKFDGDTPGTTVTFEPVAGNPYYETHTYTALTKAENTSDTTDDYFIETVNSDGSVTQQLGNNGKLVLNRVATETITVQKQWESKTKADKVEVELYATGTMSGTGKATFEAPFTVLYDTVELNAANNWTYTWSGIEKEETVGDYIYEYTNFYVREVPTDGYSATYKDKDDNEIAIQKIDYSGLDAYSTVAEEDDTNKVEVVAANTGKVVIVNTASYELPASGGLGSRWFTFSGLAMISVAVGFMYINKKRNYNEKLRGGEA